MKGRSDSLLVTELVTIVMFKLIAPTYFIIASESEECRHAPHVFIGLGLGFGACHHDTPDWSRLKQLRSLLTVDAE